MNPIIEALMRRERTLVFTGLVLLQVIAWTYLWRGAGMGMSGLEMTSVALFPHMRPDEMPGMAPPTVGFVAAITMWSVMMIAMMTPGAAPLLLLYERVLQHASAQQPTAEHRYASSTFVAAGYLAVWLAFAAAAAGAQYALARAGVISAMMLRSQSALLSATVLVAAGIYQLSPFKHTCLRRCRGPVEFLTRHWRPGVAGAFALGIKHGAWCVGCCWLLMALLFVGGVMNLVWIALLALFVLAEKLLQKDVMIGRASGAVLIAWALATLALR